MAREGLIICGSVTNGRDIFGMLADVMSCELSDIRRKERDGRDLFQQIGSQHQNIHVWLKTLGRSQITDSLLQIFLAGHDLQHIE